HRSKDDDIAVRLMSFKQHHDKSTVSLNSFLDDAIIDDNDLGIGDEVYSIGRFLDIDGSKVNRPVVRFGNVSLLTPTVPVQVRGPSKGFQDSYLVEMRSRTGFSGSPMLLYIPPLVMGSFNRKKPVHSGKWHGPWLMGVHWGQLPVVGPDAQALGKQVPLHWGSGMSAVVPAE